LNPEKIVNYLPIRGGNFEDETMEDDVGCKSEIGVREID
jgi:hypothetical protein